MAARFHPGPAIENSRAGKQQFRFKVEHDAPRSAGHDRAVKWRLWRRSTRRWLKERTESFRITDGDE